MKLKQLNKVIFSRGMADVQFVIIWDSNTCKDVLNGCSFEYALKEYGNAVVKRITACEDKLVFEI